jgi:hypothetical protein
MEQGREDERDITTPPVNAAGKLYVLIVLLTEAKEKR